MQSPIRATSPRLTSIMSRKFSISLPSKIWTDYLTLPSTTLARLSERLSRRKPMTMKMPLPPCLTNEANRPIKLTSFHSMRLLASEADTDVSL